MATPCVLHVQRRQFGRRAWIEINGMTSRKERIIGRVEQNDPRDPVSVSLTIDGVPIDAPDDLGHTVRACEWITRQVEDLGHFVVDVKVADLITR